MTISDGRVAAWLESEARLLAAQKVAVDHKKQLKDPLPEWYWALVAEADVWARLAQVSEAVGFVVGDHLVDRQREEDARRDRHADLFDSFRAGEGQ